MTSRNPILPVVILTAALFLWTSCNGAPPSSPTTSTDTEGREVEAPGETVDEPGSETAAEVIEFYENTEDTENALDALERAGIDDMDVESRLVYAALLRTTGEPERAREVLDIVVAEDPVNAEALFGIALLEDAAGNAEARDRALDAALESLPDYADAWAYRGALETRDEDWTAAAAAYRRALEIDSGHVEALVGIAWVSAKTDKLEEARDYLNRAVEEAPDFAYVYVDRARVLAALGEYNDAEDDLTEAIALEPEVPWHYLDRARIRLRFFADHEGALSDLENVERYDPGNFFALVYLAGLHDEQRRFDLARDYYLRVVEKRDDYVWAYPPLGKLEWIAGNFEEAATWFLRGAAEDDSEFAYAVLGGLALIKAGDEDTGRGILEEELQGMRKGSSTYEVVRFTLERGSDYYAVNALNKEEDATLRDRLWFYLGVAYGLEGSIAGEKAAYTRISERIGEMEFDMAYAAVGETE